MDGKCHGQAYKDVSTAHFFLNYWPLWLMLLALTTLRLPVVKGALGEWYVNWQLSNKLNTSQYHLYKNVTLPTADGSTQIDHIVVSKFGIFVIETKNMQGWIFGSEKQAQWTQQIYRHKSKFQNPLRQNQLNVAGVRVKSMTTNIY